MKNICFYKDCDNFNENFDCILHYTKIQNDALQKITLHYHALRAKMDEVMRENAKYEEEAKKSCKNSFESIYNFMKKKTDGYSSPENSNSSNSSMLRRRNKVSTSPRAGKKASISSKENSPKEKRPKSRCSGRSSKESIKEASISIDPKPSKEKRTKQTKLPFFKTTPDKNTRTCLLDEQDDDMTYCEELEKLKSKNQPNKSLNLSSQGIFNFENVPRMQRDNSKEQKKVEREKPPDVKIKQEKDSSDTSKRSFFNQQASPELFLTEDLSSSNSVIFVEPSEREIITIPDRTNPMISIFKKIEMDLSSSKKKRLFEDSISMDADEEDNFFDMEKRDFYENECDDCQIFYENVVEKKSVTEANNITNNCPIECDGWKERCKKLNKKEKPKGTVVIKCNNRFARRRKEVKDNETDPGIWNLNVSPRTSKPLFSKVNANYETPDL